MAEQISGSTAAPPLAGAQSPMRARATGTSAVEAAMAWLRAQRPKASPRTYHADAAATLLILAALHDMGTLSASVADVAMYSCLSDSAVRTRLLWLADGWPGSQRVVLRHRVGQRVWHRVDVQALAEGAKP